VQVASQQVSASTGVPLNIKKTLIVVAAGMNNTIYHAERLADEMHGRKDVPFAMGGAYFLSYLSAAGLNRLGKDAFNSYRCLSDFGLPIEKREANYLGLLAVPSLLFSATTYHVLGSTWGALTGSDAQVEPWEPFGLRMPDVFFYITSKGVTGKLVSGYRINDDIRLTFGFETVLGLERRYGLKKLKEIAKKKLSFLGDDVSVMARLMGLESMFCDSRATEFNLGIQHTLSEKWYYLSYKLATTFGEGFCAEFSVSIPVSMHWGVGIGGGTFSSESLYGERQSRNLVSKRSESAFISAFYRF
jgi:hypothetical protein